MASAKSFFSRRFLSSSDFSRYASETSSPPYLAFHQNHNHLLLAESAVLRLSPFYVADSVSKLSSFGEQATLSDLVNRKAALSPEMALPVEKVVWPQSLKFVHLGVLLGGSCDNVQVIRHGGNCDTSVEDFRDYTDPYLLARIWLGPETRDRNFNDT